MLLLHSTCWEEVDESSVGYRVFISRFLNPWHTSILAVTAIYTAAVESTISNSSILAFIYSGSAGNEEEFDLLAYGHTGSGGSYSCVRLVQAVTQPAKHIKGVLWKLCFRGFVRKVPT